MLRLTIVLAMLVIAWIAPPATAQEFLGRVAGNCTTLPATNRHSVPLDANVPAAATLVLSVAASSTLVSDLAASDPIGSRYQSLSGLRSDFGGTVVHFRAGLQRKLAAGQSIVIDYGHANGTVKSCVSVLAYRGIPFGALVQNATGSAAGASADATLTASTESGGAVEFLLAGFATNATPGTLAPTPPATALPPLCEAGGDLCLVDAQRSMSAPDTASIGLSFGATLGWTGTLTVLAADGIFGNGLD